MNLAVTIILFTVVTILTVIVVILGVRVFDKVNELKGTVETSTITNSKDRERVDGNLDNILESQKATKLSLTNDLTTVRKDLKTNVTALSNDVQYLNNSTMGLSNNLYSQLASTRNTLCNLQYSYDSTIPQKTDNSNYIGLVADFTSFKDMSTHEFATIEESQYVFSTDIMTLKNHINTSIPAIQNNIATAFSNANMLSNNLVMFSTSLAGLEPRVGALEPQVNAYEPRISRLEPRLESVASNLTALEPRISALEPRISGLEPRLDQVGSAVASLYPRFDQLTSSMSALQPRVDSLEPRVGELFPRLDQMSSNITRIEPRLNAFEPRLNAFEPRFDVLEKNYSNLSPEFDKVRDTLTGMGNKFATKELAISDYTFKMDTTENGINRGVLKLSKTTDQNDYLLLNNGASKHFTIMPGGQLNFTPLSNLSLQNINASRDQNYSMTLGSSNMMFSMPNTGSIMFSKPDNIASHQFYNTGDATHKGDVRASSIILGDKIKIIVANDNLVALHMESGRREVLTKMGAIPSPNSLVSEVNFGLPQMPQKDNKGNTLTLSPTPPKIVEDSIKGFVGLFSNSTYITVETQNLSASYTKSAYIYLTMHSVGNILSSAGTGATKHYLWFHNGTSLGAGHGNQINAYVKDPQQTPLNKWVHFVLTYNNSTNTMKLFRNGEVVSSVVDAALKWNGGTDSGIRIGAFGTGNNLTGYADNVRVWNKDLTDLEVKALYNNDMVQ
jgi:predicted  nucleic acid-binding Zn-ribbon protein